VQHFKSDIKQLHGAQQSDFEPVAILKHHAQKKSNIKITL